MLSVNTQFLTQITLCIQNWRNAKLKVRILQLHIVICYVFSPSKQLFPNLVVNNWKMSSVKLIHKRTNVRGSATKCEIGSGRSKTTRTADALMRLRMLLFVTHSTASDVRTVFSLLLPVLVLLSIHWQFMHMSTFTGRFFCAQLPLFSVNLAVIVCNVTSHKTVLCNCKTWT